ncbi:MAG: S-methyl-5-thioribose-1-phosphate isomerase [Deltaproteobacteria bacterium]|nr:S-methyl-5-thioribose-1-phosphate isomerase [Deltaproteobacteria bacterium]
MKPKQSPLFIPALWEGSHFKILDETLLPWKIDYITVDEVSQALQAVKEMKTRAFGQVLTFLYAAALVAQGTKTTNPEALKERLSQLAEEFTQARPTFNFKGLASFFSEWFRKLPAGEEVGSWIQGKAHELAARIIKAREERARRAAELLPNPCRLLTHCNISGELVAIARCCEEMGKKLYIIATETRPYLQGSRLTAWEAVQAGIKVSLIPDCAIAQVMAKEEVDAVLVGSDRSAQNGDIINKVGTYPVALMAKEFGIPFYVLVQDPGSLAKGDDVLIEERPIAELLTFQGRSLFPEDAEGIGGRYPAFDLTPASLISSLIGFDGVFTPEEFRQRFQKASPSTKEGKKNPEKYLLLYGIPKRNSYTYLSHALKAEQGQSVLVPEMRPELWGAHVVARELLERNIPTTLISDNMMGTLFAQGQIQHLCLFYSELSEKGPVGICGSLLAVLLARTHGVSVELLASEEAKQAPLDRDISTFLSQRVSPEGVAIYPIEREVVPWSLFKEDKTGI